MLHNDKKNPKKDKNKKPKKKKKMLHKEFKFGGDFF